MRSLSPWMVDLSIKGKGKSGTKIHVSLAFCIYTCSSSPILHFTISRPIHSYILLILIKPQFLLHPRLARSLPTFVIQSFPIMMPFLRSFRIHSLALALLSLLIITLVTTDSLSNPSWVVGFPSRNHEYHYVQRQRRHSLLDTCRPSSRSQLCDHLEMIRRHQRPFPPPPPLSRSNKGSDYDIDPRYGVEKRLVPSGPNPLHN